MTRAEETDVDVDASMFGPFTRLTVTPFFQLPNS